MPSRKRTQGQARKAVCAFQNGPQISNRSRATASGSPSFAFRNGGCQHGGSNLHLSTALAFVEAYSTARGQGLDVYAAVREKCPQVLDDEVVRASLRAVLLSYGATMILTGGEDEKIIAQINIEAIQFLEYVAGTLHQTAKEYMSCRDPMDGCTRSVIKFHSERLPCHCLRYAYKDTASEEKLGKCSHCKHKRERRTLLLCGRCRRHQYCSQECQGAAWPDHKAVCKVLSKV